ncbi:TIGR02996 domain-containing protein [Tuwongella immobilis]|uniref:Repeat-companion domain protein n=1 Tax=Tuwongella immobilis TaxID=692036 RepID=A0A6C2YQ48_9BACT|nr:TIGR02996 domain-containing protein [Tuwongella immobilis]VIP03596.1 leucine-rich repeat-containing protein typical subtype : Leucine-rich repeat, typical subtype OS=Naegleria gruberi GN=NAEGRDRAFT_62933 PE=4 SV=1: LRR_6: LRR_6: LRR_6: LRR_6 [Tuwongella immobilis]VTS04560.1 leucine-rich repeat-containing protein typical subtype : Leucine-rich repeat, typical subtype OS=Naegleria gruberi GN=NAEGRDRAFT_62933 PE=4 SV=1: LRR_6: LRR_6: LRR_6: LRR_6 [Tuwongella immobilis]
MSVQSSLLAAVREFPEDDAPRLIYADWFEERGGDFDFERAQFIRLQCALAQMGPDEPGRFDLESTEHKWLQRFTALWRAEQRIVAQQLHFRRGFPNHARLSWESFLTEAMNWLPESTVRHIALGPIPFQTDYSAPLRNHPIYQWIGSLELEDPPVNPNHLRAILSSRNLYGLRGLRLRPYYPESTIPGNLTYVEYLDILTHSEALRELRTLDLRGGSLSDRGAARLAQSSVLQNLQSLNLSSNRIGLAGVRNLVRSRFFPNLRRLSIGFNLLDELSLRQFAEAERDIPFQLLELTDIASISSPDVCHFLEWSGLDGIEQLRLSGSPLCESAMRVLCHPVRWEGMNRLDLNQTQLSGWSMRWLAENGHFPKLRRLDLSHNSIRDTGVRAIASASWAETLTALNLSRNQLGGPGTKALFQSTHLGLLERLDLSANYLGTPTMLAIAESSQLTNLRELNLEANHIDDEGAVALLTSPRLASVRVFRLAGNPISESCREMLGESFGIRVTL